MSEETVSSPAEEIVDDLLPVDLDWRRLVRAYPISSMAVALAGGFLVGRRHGPALLRDLSDFVTDQVTQNVQALLGGPSED